MSDEVNYEKQLQVLQTAIATASEKVREANAQVTDLTKQIRAAEERHTAIATKRLDDSSEALAQEYENVSSAIEALSRQRMRAELDVQTFGRVLAQKQQELRKTRMAQAKELLDAAEAEFAGVKQELHDAIEKELAAQYDAMIARAEAWDAQVRLLHDIARRANKLRETLEQPSVDVRIPRLGDVVYHYRQRLRRNDVDQHIRAIAGSCFPPPVVPMPVL